MSTLRDSLAITHGRKWLTSFSLIVACAAVLVAGGTASAQEEPPAERHEEPEFMHLYMGVSESCLVCHGNYALFESKGNELKYFYVDRAVFGRSVHFELGCLGCHEPMREGVHTRKRNGGEAKAERENGDWLEEELLRLRTCEGCHYEEHQKYRQSVHGLAALAEGIAEAPLCVDCHGSHYILPPEDSQAHTNPSNVAALCAKCHGDSLISAKFGMNPEVIETYGDSFHGKKEALGARRIPVCISCHGVHLIRAVDDGRSMVNDTNISRTCGQCHRGAERSFKAAFSHKQMSAGRRAFLLYLEQGFQWLILLVIAGLLMYCVLHWRYWRRVRRKDAREGADTVADSSEENPASREATLGVASGKKPRMYQRWNVAQRWQHIILIISFHLLVFTGWPLKFAHLAISKYAIWLFGGVAGARIIHRIGAVGLISVCVFHIVYLAVMYFRGHRELPMLPRMKDFRDFWGDIKLYLGLSTERPRYDRYNYMDKFGYLAVFWGVAMLIPGGLVLWFPRAAIEYIGGWVYDLSVLLHGHEAWLAAMAIFTWHLYWQHLNPRVYPMNPIWLSGEVTVEELKEERPVEYERLKKEGRLPS